MDRKCLLAGLATGVLSLLAGFLVHGQLLGAEYAKLGNLFRPQAQQATMFPYMVVAHLIFGLAFAWVYLQGKKAGVGTLGQGARYGLAVALLAVVPMYLIYYAVQPMPGTLVAKQILFDGVVMVLLGIAIAYMLRAPGEA